MGKFATYIMMMSGLTLLFYFTGLLGETANSTLLNLLLNPENIASTSFTTAILTAILGISTVGVIAIGLVTGNIELAIMSPVAAYMLALGWDFVSVAQVVIAQDKVIGILLFAPILLLYVITIIEWWRGRD